MDDDSSYEEEESDWNADVREELDGALWGQLPADVLNKVLTKLPVHSLMRFCQVCKRWKTLIQSAEFARRCHSIKPTVFAHYPGGYGDNDLYVPPYLAFPSATTDTWEKHMLDFGSEPMGEVVLLAADQGLLCFLNKPLYWPGSLVIYNPLTRHCKELTVPRVLRCRDWRLHMDNMNKIVGLIVDPETGSYKLVVGFIHKAGEDEDPDDPNGTYIYDSVSSSWTSIPLSPEFPQLPEVHTISENEDEDNEDGEDILGYFRGKSIPGPSISCSGNLYWIVGESLLNGFWDDYSRFLVKYDVMAGRWTVDEPILRIPYSRFVHRREIPDDLPRHLPYARLVKQPDLPQEHITLPRWNFHLAVHDGEVFVTLFDSLISELAYFGEFSSMIPERRGMHPLIIVTIGIHKATFYSWLPPLEPDSSCSHALPKCHPPSRLPDIHTFGASFKAFV
ncbi:hypothetical protein R1sor_026603 [Riccia sorocarpa]|uniref:F-box domain-containing protein n=1 Tax=Riccia sorocarpa TaxID=122646 RepID=A0ABD3GEZ9_9MARC